MIKKKVRLGRQEKSYKLVAFTLNVFESVKLVKMEERRRIPSYAQAQRV
jgi:hypothetical protein